MSRIVTLHNVSGAGKTYRGQDILDTETFTIPTNDVKSYSTLNALFADVAAGDILIGDGTTDFTDPTQGWAWLQGDVMDVTVTQQTAALGGKVAVHSSPKPEIEGIETFVVWTGAGDDVSDPNNPVIGEGDLLNLQMTINTPEVTKDIIWSQEHFGRVWIHEAYLKFSNGGNGDYLTAYVMCKPSTILDAATVAALEAGAQIPPGSVSLDLVLDNDDNTRVKFSPGGPGTGTHGFGGVPVLVPHTRALNGDWDYDGTNLVPNMTGTGAFRIYTTEREAHKYVNKVPCFGDCTTYFMMSSDETAEIRDGYFLRVKAFNVSNTNWQASVIMEIYREQTTGQPDPV